ncbi:hypothetical protein QBC40DRAFT_262139 [Triangularia verruculosa]|uniref:ATP-dependent DNA ligase family profile domain-containing protein n=1 Tax=Triangularia verruculosa TaxID=2587418 RepID=A0AAN6XR13_9PEZI|nr:hypothetical protein QBC40DRAFT_262139 [Triangularia verruculosa]
MPFLFSYVADLLQKLEDNRAKRSGVKTPAAIVQDWFQYHKGLFHHDEFNTAALLSTLLPEKRTDRAYNIREKKLQTLIGRGLILGRSRIAQLGRWTRPEAGVDLAECVEGILNETPNPVPANEVTVEEIDGLLHSIAAACRFSSPSVRSSGVASSGSTPVDKELAIGDLYRRLSARDAKWLTRMILKNYEPVIIDPGTVYRCLHPLLPAILKVQDDIAVAGAILDKQRRERTVTGRNELAQYLKPTLGVKVGRQTWIKGRGIKHCLGMVHGRISCEEKLDGEYCQIHIDLSRGKNCIQIFSKSGKDSTADRFKLHDAIRESLRIGKPTCPIKKGCILEGELVVYSDKEHRILDFHKIRKHVSRSGSFIGTAQDSQAHSWEHLMIVYYDILMLDDMSLLSVKHSERRQKLKELITVVPGHSALVKRILIDCDRRTAKSDLRRAFAKCITAKGEGLVLKSDDPYFDFGIMRKPYRCCIIKLKKEYIGNFGDIGGFAVVGARYDASRAKAYNIPRLKWTHFYVGCLENKEEVRRFGKKPKFVVTNVVELNKSQLETLVAYVNPEAISVAENPAIDLRVEPGIDEGRRPVIIFPTPPVVDLRCFSFDKEGNTGFWSPRFPVVNKVHCDRTFHDTISFPELQELAEQEKTMASHDDSQEVLTWIASLEGVEPSSQSTAAPATPSQRTSIQDRNTASAGSPVGASPRDPGHFHTGASTISAPRTQSGPSTTDDGQDENAADENRSLARENRLLAGANLQARKRSADALELGFDQESKVPRRTHAHSAPNTGMVASASREPLAEIRHSSQRAHGPRMGHFNILRPQPSPPIASPAAGHAEVVAHQEPSVSAAKVWKKPSASVPRIADFPDDEVSVISHRCISLPISCELASYSVLLSPCVANTPYIADLLRIHGVQQFINDPEVWTAAEFASTKRLILVEAEREEATREFLQEVKSYDFKKRDWDEHEFIPVFDWRVLERLKKEEMLKGRESRFAQKDERFSVVIKRRGNFGPIWKCYAKGLA